MWFSAVQIQVDWVEVDNRMSCNICRESRDREESLDWWVHDDVFCFSHIIQWHNFQLVFLFYREAAASCGNARFLQQNFYFFIFWLQRGEKGDTGRLGIAGIPGLPGSPVSATWLCCFILSWKPQNTPLCPYPQGRAGIDGKRGQSGKDVRHFDLNGETLRGFLPAVQNIWTCLLFTGRKGSQRRRRRQGPSKRQQKMFLCQSLSPYVNCMLPPGREGGSRRKCKYLSFIVNVICQYCVLHLK